MLLSMEVAAILILLAVLTYIRYSRKKPEEELVWSDEEFCRRRVRAEEYFYGGSWKTGNQGRWD